MKIEPIKGKKLFKAILRDVKPIRGGLLLGALLSLFSVAANIVSPYFVGLTVDVFSDYGDTGVFVLQNFIRLIIILLCVYGAHSLFSALKTVILNNIVSRYFTCKLRVKMSDKVKRLPVSFVDSAGKGEFIERMTEDVSVVGMTLHSIIDLFVLGLLQLVFIVFMMFWVDWRMALIVLVSVPFSVAAAVMMSRRMSKYFQTYMAEAGKLYGAIEESYSGVKTVRTYGFRNALMKKHEETNAKLTEAGYRGGGMAALMQPVVSIINKICYVAVCLIGALLAINGYISVGDVVTIVLYAAMLSMPLDSIAHSMSMTQRAAAAAGRVYGMLALPEIAEEGEPVFLPGESVVLDSVDFGYEADKPVLRGLNVNVSKGQKIAVVGPTGGGKTTLVNLLMRFYDPLSGTISVDGRDTARLPRQTVRDAFAMVLQDTWLFSGTIVENVAYGKPGATLAEIKEACRLAYCDGFIETLPKGYDTEISEGADNISQGQKQLLTIARALIADRPMLILDEATSSVDTRTEGLLQKAMDRLTENRTCFVIAHRLSTIINADNILVIDGGKIVGQGSHAELLEGRGLYYDMFQSQYSIG